MKEELESFINQKVVLDTDSSWLYIGVLSRVTSNCAVLTDVDVHDSGDSNTTKDIYVHSARAAGSHPNREKAYVSLGHVVSFSLLDDVKHF